MVGEKLILKKCILCGCKDHKLIGCVSHVLDKCSCNKKLKKNGATRIRT